MADKEGLNLYLDNIFRTLKSSDNLMKLIYYNSPDALSQPNLDGETKQSLIYTKIFPYSFIPEIIKKEASFINMSFRNFRQIPNSRVFQAGRIVFFMTCHKSLWETDLGLRPLCIFNEISKLFTNTKGIGMGELIFDNSDEYWYDKDLGGYYIAYEITDFRDNLPR